MKYENTFYFFWAWNFRFYRIFSVPFMWHSSQLDVFNIVSTLFKFEEKKKHNICVNSSDKQFEFGLIILCNKNLSFHLIFYLRAIFTKSGKNISFFIIFLSKKHHKNFAANVHFMERTHALCYHIDYHKAHIVSLTY